jgi:integrase
MNTAAGLAKRPIHVPGPAEACRSGIPAASGLALLRERFPARSHADSWRETTASHEEIIERVAGLSTALTHTERRGVRLVRSTGRLLDWLQTQPGEDWQQRWRSSGVEGLPRGEWTALVGGWSGKTGRGAHDDSNLALRALMCADVVRPGLMFLLKHSFPKLDVSLAEVRGDDGFTALWALPDADGTLGSEAPKSTMLIAKLAIAKGGTVADITVGDCVEAFELQRAEGLYYLRVNGMYTMLRLLGMFPPDAPASFRALSTVIGQLDVPGLVDRYPIRCLPVRELIIDYLREREPAVDYVTLRQLARVLAGDFWADLERHHPGIDSLRLTPAIAAAWKQRRRVKTRNLRGADGTVTTVEVPRLSDNELIVVRAFYQDLAQWALEEPARWGPWVAPNPVRDDDTLHAKQERRRKARMDQRTRERLPTLPALARIAAARLKTAAERLAAATAAEPGAEFSFGTESWRRVQMSRHNYIKVWAHDLATGRRVDLTEAEHKAFWAWAAIEVLRHTGVRIEELLELTVHSIIEYRLPSTGELVPLLQIAPSKADAERLILVDPELADVLAAIVHRIRTADGTVPLVTVYDRWERVWNPPLPLLFQRSWGGERRGICPVAVAKLLNTTMEAAGFTDAHGAPMRITPHDFRRMFITDLVMNGLPPHIAQVIAGHADLNTTMRYKAVYPHEAIEAHRAFIARRRATRPSAEYRTPTEQEWDEFLSHFEKRKLSVGICARAFATPCIHEHACVRCSLLRPDPAQRGRLEEIRDNLIARIAEAEREGWLGEVEGLRVSLAGAKTKLAQIDARANEAASTPLGAPVCVTITTAPSALRAQRG